MTTKMTAQAKILWYCLNRVDQSKEIFDLVSPDLFYLPELKRIYEQFFTGNIKLSMGQFNTLDNLGVFKEEWLCESPNNLRKQIENDWIEHKGKHLLAKAYNKLEQGKNPKAYLTEFQKLSSEKKKKQSTLKDLFNEIAEDHVKGRTKGLTTGIKKLDQYTERLKKGHFWVIAGYTGYGKTTLALQMALNLILQGKKVDFISLEMSARQLIEKLIWVNSTLKQIKFENSLNELVDCNFTVTENLRTIENIKSHILSIESDLIVLDYIQLVRGGESYFDEATQCANVLQEMAISQQIPIIGLSQVTKESAKSKGSAVMDFKNSGAIAESADVAIEIQRDKENEVELSECNLLLKKNRHGQSGRIETIFDTSKGVFRHDSC
mgnify:CR=1 FL=1|jgi:replicative DNA helicase|tara:strand:- start:17960 stop:19096 length:1137 start_codon:yes stop_codon:yes gene_type:complete